MDKIKIKNNRAFVLLKDLSDISKDLREVVDIEQWIPITKKEMTVENVKISIETEEIFIEIGNAGDQLVRKVLKPEIEKEKAKVIPRLPEIFPFSDENKLHEYDTKLKSQKFYIGEATLRNYPICETMLVLVSYGYIKSKKTVKRDVKGLYISFSGSIWSKMGGGRSTVKIRFSRLLLAPQYQNSSRLRFTSENTINISAVSEFKGNRFFDLKANYNGNIKNQILNKRAMDK